MRKMTKRVFQGILERQRSSGLAIREFCLNESYNPASFHYWKSKFGFTGTNATPGGRSDDHSGDFAPLSFPVAQKQPDTVVLTSIRPKQPI